jgi:hypothetical protein
MEEAIALADAQARVRGYDLGRYQRLQAQYTAAEDTWAVSYDAKPAAGQADGEKHFSVTVEDKTRRTEVVAPKDK